MKPPLLPTILCWATQLAFRRRNVLRVPSHLTFKERAVLYGLAKRHGGTRIVEIGSYLGASASLMAAGLRDACLSGCVVCIDTWKNDAMIEGKRDTWLIFCANTAEFADLVVPLRGWSHEVAQQAALAGQGPFSLAFFDGDHGYESVARDWLAYRPLLAPGAVVAFHDIGWAEGVQKVIHEEVAPRLAWSGRLPNLFWGKLRA